MSEYFNWLLVIKYIEQVIKNNIRSSLKARMDNVVRGTKTAVKSCQTNAVLLSQKFLIMK